METRAMAIAFFYAVGTGLGGIIGPILFGKFIEQGRDQVVVGYYIGAGLMIAAGLVEMFLGVDAAQRSLEDVAEPLTAQDADGRDAEIDLRDGQPTADSDDDRTPGRHRSGARCAATTSDRRQPAQAVRRRRVAAPRPSASTTAPTTTPRSTHVLGGDRRRVVVTSRSASTA